MSHPEWGSRLGAKEAAVGLGLFGASTGLVFLAAREIKGRLRILNDQLNELNKNLSDIRTQLEEINKRVPQGGVEDLIEAMADAATVVGAFTGSNIIRPSRIEKLRKRSQ